MSRPALLSQARIYVTVVGVQRHGLKAGFAAFRVPQAALLYPRDDN